MAIVEKLAERHTANTRLWCDGGTYAVEPIATIGEVCAYGRELLEWAAQRADAEARDWEQIGNKERALTARAIAAAIRAGTGE